VHLGRDTSHLTRKDTASLSSELGKNLRVLVADFLKRKVKTTGRHRLVVLPEVNAALNGLRLGHNEKW